MLAWALRYILFAFGDAGSLSFMLILGIALHGVCYDFFFVTGQIYTDLKAGDKIKSQAQGLISLATYGVGMFIGSIISGKVKDMFTATITNWTNVWLAPAGIAVIVLILFLLFFRDNMTKQSI